MAPQTRSWPDGRRKTTALLAPLLAVAFAPACGSSAQPETPPAAEQAPPPSPVARARTPTGGVTLQLEDVPPDVRTFSFVLIPGTHAPHSVDEIWTIARADRGARLEIGGDTVVTFDRVDPGAYTACAIAKADRDHALGFDCKPVEGPTVTLAPLP
jgi:Tfp pilus assembly protein FimV